MWEVGGWRAPNHTTAYFHTTEPLLSACNVYIGRTPGPPPTNAELIPSMLGLSTIAAARAATRRSRPRDAQILLLTSRRPLSATQSPSTRKIDPTASDASSDAAKQAPNPQDFVKVRLEPGESYTEASWQSHPWFVQPCYGVRRPGRRFVGERDAGLRTRRRALVRALCNASRGHDREARSGKAALHVRGIGGGARPIRRGAEAQRRRAEIDELELRDIRVRRDDAVRGLDVAVDHS